jgi:hypothetical protein
VFAEEVRITDRDFLLAASGSTLPPQEFRRITRAEAASLFAQLFSGPVPRVGCFITSAGPNESIGWPGRLSDDRRVGLALLANAPDAASYLVRFAFDPAAEGAPHLIGEIDIGGQLPVWTPAIKSNPRYQQACNPGGWRPSAIFAPVAPPPPP